MLTKGGDPAYGSGMPGGKKKTQARGKIHDVTNPQQIDLGK